MPDAVLKLTEMIARNGYQVACTIGPDRTLVEIVHEPTQREAVYGFNVTSRAAALSAMASQYCTVDQLNELASFGLGLIDAGQASLHV
jgi:hypothetical protein